MKQLMMFCAVALIFALSSCQLAGDIFKAGVWVGILAVVGIVALIIFLVAKAGGK